MTASIRVAGLALLASVTWYVPWLVGSLNWSAPWLALPFAAANLLVVVCVLITVINDWQRSIPRRRGVLRDHEPEVAVIIPTCGEPGWMVARTAASVIEQEWPSERLLVIISDDAHSPQAEDAAQACAALHPRARVVYHRPPRRGDPRRRGDAKAGNLNSVLDLLRLEHPELRYVETRDADDEVGDRWFLRETVAQLMHDDRLAYVQTIKEAKVGKGDPFGNLDPLFYRGAMFARNAGNAVFPCGSGLVWRRAALDDIGGFPVWNLVEDLQSGVEALRRGWRGMYLPIVGAIGQVAPEDIPNVYKQRGTWALDTVRLLLFGGMKGLNLRQRLHFAELGLFYVLSLATLTFLLCPAVALLTDRYPLVTTQSSYAAHFWPFALSVEVFLASLCRGHRYETLWRARQIWVGLAPVYAKACFMAVWNGPNRKPTYRVTRKDQRVAWYWRETLPQTAIVALLAVSILYGFTTSSVVEALDLGSVYWAGFSSVFLVGFIRKSWFGLAWQTRLRRRRGASPHAAEVPSTIVLPEAAPHVVVPSLRKRP